jgi:hypothetical protein
VVMMLVKVDKLYKWVLDSREGRNEVFVGETKKESEKDKWLIKRLKLSHFIVLRDGVKDLDCADMTNENADGIVTFKSFEDLIGSTTGDNSHHFEEEVIKIWGTGFPACLIIWGSRFAYQAASGVSDELILSGLQKCATIQAVFKIPAIWVESANEAMECGKSFIRHCNQLPRRLPVYCVLKQDQMLAVLVGFNKIGEKTAKLIKRKWKALIHVFKFIIERDGIMEHDEIAAEFKANTQGLRIDQAQSIVNTIFKGR